MKVITGLTNPCGGLSPHLWLPLIQSSQILLRFYRCYWGAYCQSGVRLWPNGQHLCSCLFALCQAHIGKTKHQQNINPETLMDGWWNIDFCKTCKYFVDIVASWSSTKDKRVINIHFILNNCWGFIDFVLTKCWWCVFVLMSYWFSFDKM